MTGQQQSRATRLDTVKSIYKTLEFSDEEIEFLIKKGYKSPLSILHAYGAGDKIYKLVCDEFPEGLCDTLHHLGAYFVWHQKAKGELSDFTSFTLEEFEAFIPEDPKSNQKGGATVSGTPTHNTGRPISVKISDYPTFSGKSQDFNQFYEKFTATAELQGIGYLLKPDTDHDNKFLNDPKYKADCAMLYSILKHTCASGHALPKVKALKDTQDGYAVFQTLYNSYYAYGNTEQYASSCLEKLLALKLHATSGMDAYLSKHENLVLELQGINPLTENQKKTILLNGIEDPLYETVKDIAKVNQLDYEATMIELRRVANEKKMAGISLGRRTNKLNTSTGSGTKGYKLPGHVWKAMTNTERKDYIQSHRGHYQNSNEVDGKDPKNEKNTCDCPPRQANLLVSTQEYEDSNKSDDPKDDDKTKKNSMAVTNPEPGDIWCTLKPKKRSTTKDN